MHDDTLSKYLSAFGSIPGFTLKADTNANTQGSASGASRIA